MTDTEVSLQCGQETRGSLVEENTRSESSPQDVNMAEEFGLELSRDTEVTLQWGDTEMSLPVPQSSIEDDVEFTVVTRKRRKHDQPMSPSASEPTRAQR